MIFQSLALAQVPRKDPLNVVLILVDDMGWTDLGCFGSRFYKTPNIDRLAAKGMRFTNAYSACTVCSPSRASIMTGKYPARLKLTDWIPGHRYPWAKLRIPDWAAGLPLEERTLAEAVKPRGSATASIGKWHLTPVSGSDAYYPDRQGFDRNIAGTFRGQPPSYFSPYKIETLADGPTGEYLTDREVTEAIRFIDQHQNKPFFVYLPHHAVHNPVQAKEPVIERYSKLSQKGAPHHHPGYAAMIDSLDENVGRLMQRLEETGLDKKTAIIFTSDNGGLVSNTSNAPLRAGKGSVYEGGVRVPLIIQWPGVTSAGSRCDVPVIGADLYPTVVDMAGGSLQAGQVLDGVSLKPLLQAGGNPARGWKRDALYWHYPHYHPGTASPYSAVRSGDWKLIEFLEDNRVELYNLRDDASESRDLSAKLPKKVGELRRRLHVWRQEVDAQMPSPNPSHDPVREREIERRR